MSSSRPRESVNRLESTTARIPSVSRSNRRPSIRTNVDSHSPVAGGRSPPSHIGGPSAAPLAETLLARRGQLPSQRSYRTADDRSSLAGTADGESRGPVWGVGGVFPRAPVKRRRPKARDFEAERAADAERAAAADGGRIPRYTTGTMETADTLGSPVLEQPDPFAALGGSAEARKTNPSLAPASIRSTSANPAPSVRSISRNQAPSLHSRSTTACDETSPKRELDEDEAQSPTNTHDDEQGQVGGVLMEDREQWEEEMEGDQVEPPVRNQWSRIRYTLREPFAEWLGMLILIVLGVGANCQVKISDNQAGAYSDMNWSWGFGVMSGIYVAGGISGGHLNPAITIALACFRGFPWRMVPRYIIAQTFGAFCGALIIYSNYMRALDEYDPQKLIYNAILDNGTNVGNASASLFITLPNSQAGGAAQGFFQELLATAVLAIIVLALGDENNAPPGAGLGALVLGFVVTAIGMSMGWVSGYAVNCSRDFGPRLALWCLGYGKELWLHDNRWWLVGPILGPIVGALVGCFVYDLLIFTGAGSPLNSSSEELAYALHMPRLHAMVRSAVMRDRPLSPKREAQLEDGRFFHDEHLRRTGRAPKSEVEVRNRWEAGGDKVERVEQELRERRERREKQIVAARREREAQILEEREQEVAGAV